MALDAQATKATVCGLTMTTNVADRIVSVPAVPQKEIETKIRQCCGTSGDIRLTGWGCPKRDTCQTIDFL